MSMLRWSNKLCNYLGSFYWWKEIKSKLRTHPCHAEPQHRDDMSLYLSRCSGNILQLAENSSAAEQVEEKGSRLHTKVTGLFTSQWSEHSAAVQGSTSTEWTEDGNVHLKGYKQLNESLKD